MTHVSGTTDLMLVVTRPIVYLFRSPVLLSELHNWQSASDCGKIFKFIAGNSSYYAKVNSIGDILSSFLHFHFFKCISFITFSSQNIGGLGYIVFEKLVGFRRGVRLLVIGVSFVLFELTFVLIFMAVVMVVP